MFRFFPMCPRSHSSATFPTTRSFPACSPLSHYFHLFWGFFLTLLSIQAWEQQRPQLLPAPRPGSLLCIRTHRQVHMAAGARAGRYARGTGARGVGHRCTQHSPRARRPVWPWEPARSPAHLFSLWRLMILCWSCLPAVCQRGPKMSRTPTPRKAGKDTHCQCSDVFTFQLTSTVSRIQFGWKQ